MTADSMRYRLDTNDRALIIERLRDRLGIEKDRYKADVLDAALLHLAQSLDNMENAREDVSPDVIQRFNTDVVQLHYRTSLDATAAVDLEQRGRRGRR